MSETRSPTSRVRHVVSSIDEDDRLRSVHELDRDPRVEPPLEQVNVRQSVVDAMSQSSPG